MMGHVETGQEVNLFDASWREINYFCYVQFSRVLMIPRFL